MPFKSENNDQMPNESQYKSYVQEGLSNRRIVTRNILLINDSNDDKILTERAPVSIDQQENVFFRDLIIYLREQNLIQPGSSIFFYDEQRKVFVHSGTEPITANTMIPLQRFNNEQITIKYRPMQQSYHRMNNCENSNMFNYRMNQNSQYPSNIAQNNACRDIFFSNKQRSVFDCNGNNGGAFNSYNNSQNNFTSNTQSNSCNQNMSLNQQNMMMNGEDEDEMNFDASTKAIPREKRVKERKIGYVYEKVMEWRRYYESGIQNEQGRLVKVNLDVAASMVGLSRKTLDDYYKYIRKAETYNFDFKGRSEEKIGVLRNFVRDRQKRQNKNDDDDVQVEDENREVTSNVESTCNTNHNTNSRQENNNDNNNTQTSNKWNVNQPSSSENNRHLPPPPPYSKEEESVYNKNYISQNQQYQQEQLLQETEMRMRQVRTNNEQAEFHQREEMCGEENRYQYNNCNTTFEEERYPAYIGADAQTQCMEIEKCPQSTSLNNFMQQSNSNFLFDHFNNSFEHHDLHMIKQMSIPGINFSSFHNENNFYIKQEQMDNRSLDSFNNGASPHDEDQECNFLNDEAGMQANLQED